MNAITQKKWDEIRNEALFSKKLIHSSLFYDLKYRKLIVLDEEEDGVVLEAEDGVDVVNDDEGDEDDVNEEVVEDDDVEVAEEIVVLVVEEVEGLVVDRGAVEVPTFVTDDVDDSSTNT